MAARDGFRRRIDRSTGLFLLVLAVAVGVTPSAGPGCTDADGDGFCEADDCNDTLATCTTDCTDGDGDGFCAAADCDDAWFGCRADCTDEDGDGVCNDLDICSEIYNPLQRFGHKLNGPIAPTAGSVRGFYASIDGRVFYLADEEVFGRTEIYLTHISGSGVRKKIHPDLGFGQRVDSFRPPPPGGAVVVYTADLDIDERFELYGVPAGGGTPVKLSGPVIPEGDVDSFHQTPDGMRVVYRADQDIDERIELYSAPVDGSSPAAKSTGRWSGGHVHLA